MVEKLISQGVECCEKARFEEGVKYFDQALVQSPDHLLALNNRARALSRVGRLQDALADFEKMVTLQPQNAQFIGDYAVALHLNERNEEASQLFDKALALDPQNPYRYSSRAFFKDRIGDAEGAIADYDRCIALDPEDAIALNNKGLVEEKLGYQDRAKKSFDQSNKLVGYKPEGALGSEAGNTNSSSQIPNPKTVATTQPTTRWEAVKSVFTKEGFKDFLRFSKGLISSK
jgi:tetratricopeptide (TPR) repeat protein